MKFTRWARAALAGLLMIFAFVAARAQEKVNVTFDDKTPGVVYIETGGERMRVDTTKKTVEHLGAAPETQPETAAAGEKPDKTQADKAAAKDEDESPYDFDKGDEPFDFRVVNVPTPRTVLRHSWNLTFTHRFSETIDPIKSSAKDLFGLDSFGIA